MVEVDLYVAVAVGAIILLLYHYASKKYEYFLAKPIPVLKPTFLLGSTGPMMFRRRDVSSHVKLLYDAFEDYK